MNLDSLSKFLYNNEDYGTTELEEQTNMKGKKSQQFLAFHNKDHFCNTVRMKGINKRKIDERYLLLL